MKQIWFKKLGWVYWPVHPMGVVISFMAIVFFNTGLYGHCTQVIQFPMIFMNFLCILPVLPSGGSGLQRKQVTQFHQKINSLFYNGSS